MVFIKELQHTLEHYSRTTMVNKNTEGILIYWSEAPNTQKSFDFDILEEFIEGNFNPVMQKQQLRWFYL